MFTHILTWLLPLFIFFGIEAIFRLPKLLFWVFPILIIAVFFTVWSISGRTLKKHFWRYLLSPLLFVASATLFMSILEGNILKHMVAFLLSLFLAVFLENMYVYWHDPKKFQSYATLNISSYFNILIVFLTTSVVYWFSIFLLVPFWVSAFIVLVVTFLLTYQVLTVGEFMMKEKWLYIIFLPIIIFEIFWSVTFLPTSIFINAALITLSYYMFIGLGRNQLLKIMNTKTVARYLTVFGICLLFIFATAKFV